MLKKNVIAAILASSALLFVGRPLDAATAPATRTSAAGSTVPAKSVHKRSTRKRHHAANARKHKAAPVSKASSK